MFTGRSIQLIRAMMGASQSEIASQTGVSPALISHIENGHRNITPNVERRLREAFSIDEDTLREINALEIKIR